ncbi:MAG: YceI family protein [Bacteroidia bacterium]|nr:YceI family protein [Bacteroidia bacterium]
MKLIKLFLIVITVSTVMSFTAKDNLFKVDIEKSKLTWVGKKVTGAHTGTINLTEGSFVTNGKKVTGGSFAIDMTSITDTDITNPGGNERLVNHLKSDDFFSSEKHPKANSISGQNVLAITPK